MDDFCGDIFIHSFVHNSFIICWLILLIQLFAWEAWTTFLLFSIWRESELRVKLKLVELLTEKAGNEVGRKVSEGNNASSILFCSSPFIPSLRSLLPLSMQFVLVKNFLLRSDLLTFYHWLIRVEQIARTTWRNLSSSFNSELRLEWKVVKHFCFHFRNAAQLGLFGKWSILFHFQLHLVHLPVTFSLIAWKLESRTWNNHIFVEIKILSNRYQSFSFNVSLISQIPLEAAR